MCSALRLPSVRSGSANLDVVGAAEAVVVAQRSGRGGVLVEPERDLRLDRSAKGVVPGGGAGGAG